MAATNNPMEKSYSHGSPTLVSQKTYHIAGILCTVHGLSEIPSEVKDIACLWLLHPRLQKQECMAPVAASIINAWNAKLQLPQTPRRGLIAVSFDQRNHGTRLVHRKANDAWKQGNETHAQDMFSIYRRSYDVPPQVPLPEFLTEMGRKMALPRIHPF